jgi:hypothetical protein
VEGIPEILEGAVVVEPARPPRTEALQPEEPDLLLRDVAAEAAIGQKIGEAGLFPGPGGIRSLDEGESPVRLIDEIGVQGDPQGEALQIDRPGFQDRFKEGDAALA